MLQSMRSAAKYIWWFIVITFLIGFVFLGQSGLDTGGKLTRGSTVAKVNGTEITYDTWLRETQSRVRGIQQQDSRPLTLDQERRIEDQVFNDLVNNILLQQEYAKRGITVTDDEIRQAALTEPPAELMQNAAFQTEGRFDYDKYRRFLQSPMARQELIGLEGYYRERIPERKLFEQIATATYVTDAELWRAWQDIHDSAQVSYVALDASAIPDSAVHVTDAEIAQYFDAHRDAFTDHPGRAVLSVTRIPRVVTPADTAAARARALRIRAEIAGGAKFDDVARRESADTASASQGGSLGQMTRGQFVKPFEDAAYKLKPGELSQPVLSPFGFHIIRVDSAKGDTLDVRHILVRITQSDSSAARTDREADALAKAANSEKPALFDTVTKSLGLTVARVAAIEGEPLTWDSRYVPGISAWAFGGAKPGEVSDLVDADSAYYLARLDSLAPGWSSMLPDAHGRGADKRALAAFTDDIRAELVREKKLGALRPRAQQIASAVAAGKSLEQAAKDAGLSVKKTEMFTRVSSVPGLGQATEAVGAAFALPVGAVSEPAKTRSSLVVERIERRVTADRAAWEKQKQAQREQMMDEVRQQRVREFLASLRESASIVDRRKEIQSQQRQTAS